MSSEKFLDELLKKAIKKCYREPRFMLKNKKNGDERSGMEQALAFRVGLHLHNLIKKDAELKLYDLDMEYNKNEIRSKFNNDNNATRPDLIIHERWENKNNLLIVEFKDVRGYNTTGDVEKLEFFTNPSYEYKYDLGILVKLKMDVNNVVYEYFRGGKKIEEDELKSDNVLHFK